MKVNKNDIASAATTTKLLEIARKHFSQYGYDNSSLEAIAKEANQTRGAVYHHYKNKKGLFLAVLGQVQREVGAHVENEAMKSEDVWEQLVLGCMGFIEAATLESNKRILLIDSLNVVEWDEWRKMDHENSVSLLKEQLQLIEEVGELVALDVTVMAHLISGALNELSLHLAESKAMNAHNTRDYVVCLLKGFRRDG